MRGMREFPSQVEGLKYFLRLIVGATCPHYLEGNLQPLLEKIEAAIGEPRQVFEDLAPMLSYLQERSFCDGTAYVDFSWAITHGKSVRLAGTAHWKGQWTTGRFIRMIFNADTASCVMLYDTGYESHTPQGCETEDGAPKGASSFLGLPMEGDRDLTSESTREEFSTFAFEECGG